MGDEKPSHYLQKIRNLASGQINEKVLRSLFLEQLPDNIRSILVITETQDLGKLALQADKIAEMQAVNVAAVSFTSTASSPPDKMTALQEQIGALTKMVETLTTRVSRVDQRSWRQWRRRRSNSREPRSPHRSRSNDGLCFYHRRFADRANRCIIPCSWTGPPPHGPSGNRSPAQLPEN
ncbi:uncharacterized protein LOC114881160 [Osmia bicornis bicornis]|uniref:uncharacterized protein LOC114881160 n=1 Tax=Osmia bicornis bicornis TaxID=1437191 RepID=UPI001EAF6E1E|nr:uncharacterized protein LOC114881160 [Osmia bicornis bicornis]